MIELQILVSEKAGKSQFWDQYKEPLIRHRAL
jgi:hypothetical protein